jgi:hypothetical protein
MPNSTTDPNERVRCKRAMSDYSEFIGFMAEKSSAEQRRFYYWELPIA